MRKRGLAFLVIVSAAAQPLPARADGTITGVTPNPPTVNTCAIETITVNGTGECASFFLNFGDGHKELVLSPLHGPPVKFPATLTHRYSTVGTYTVTADGSQSCPGTASARLQVTAGPWIASMFTLGFFFSADATPGALVILQGENFGNTPGQVWIHLVTYDGKPSDHKLLVPQNDWARLWDGNSSLQSLRDWHLPHQSLP